MIKRPKPGETEEDLLKFQEEFLAKKETVSSVTLLKRADKRKTDDGQKDVVQIGSLPTSAPSEEAIDKTSKFRRLQDNQNPPNTRDDAEERFEKQDKHIAQVLSHIIERDTRNAAVFLPRQTTQAFPTALHRGRNREDTGTAKKKKSLFARQIEATGIKDFGVVLEQEIQKHGEVSTFSIRETEMEGDEASSTIVEGIGLSATLGTSEAKKIHAENVDLLAAMSQEEIEEERNKLLQSLDPKLVEFLRSRKKKVTNKIEEENETIPINKRTQRKNSKKGNAEQSEVGMATDSRWVNMDKIEYDKLEWMKDLPPPSTGCSKSGTTARFDFQGNLLSSEVDIPVHQGLHHHGDEPERAGYTLEEMFQLARSATIQQRVLALSVLARVIRQAKSGSYLEHIQRPIVPAILQSGVLFLFRWAMDDSVDAVLSSAIAAMHSLICCQDDQENLELTFSWFQGHVLPSQCPVAMEAELNDGGEKLEETDADVAKRDVILCLASRMMFLRRLTHVLEVRKLQAVSVVHVLELLTKIAQHSPGLAYDIIRCPRLLDVAFKEFLPLSWTPQESRSKVSNVYNYPLSAALRLVASLCSAGRNMAAHLIEKFQLPNILFRFMAVKESDLQLPKEDAVSLQNTSFRVWRICLSYGLSTHTYLDMYPVLLGAKQSSHFTDTSCTVPVLATLFSCCEALIYVVASGQRSSGFVRSTDGSSMDIEASQDIAVPDLGWSQVLGLVPSIKCQTLLILENIRCNYHFKKSDLQVATSCINFLAAYYSQCHSQIDFNAVECLQDIETLCDTCLLPLWRSLGFKAILGSISDHSNLLSPPDIATNETSPCLIELVSALPARDFQVPVIRPHSPIGFLTALLRLVLALCKRHKDMQSKMLPTITENEHLMSYMKNVAKIRTSCLAENHFTQFENYLQYYFLKLVTLKPTSNMSIFHKCSLRLLGRMQHGDEHIVHDLLSTIIFNPYFIPESESDQLACENLQAMKISGQVSITSATQLEATGRTNELLNSVCKELPSIRAMYINRLSTAENAVIASRHRHMCHSLEIHSLMVDRSMGSVLPRDWMYLPLIQLFASAAVPGSSLQECIPPHLISMATNVLYWVNLIERWRPNVIESVSATLKLTRILCTFMAGNDLFLDSRISNLLAAMLQEFTKSTVLDQLDFTENIPGLSAFYDLFSELVDQFEAVSFGDALFANYILLPLQRKHDVLMRRLIWGEKLRVLRIFRIPLTEVLVPIEYLLVPDETDQILLDLYFQCLLSKTVQHIWSPVMYLIAVHHVNRFLYHQGDDSFQATRERMWKLLIRSKLENVKSHVINYKMADVHEEYGMIFYMELPRNRQIVKDKMSV